MERRLIVILVGATMVALLCATPSASAAGCGAGPASASALLAAENELAAGIAADRGALGQGALAGEAKLTSIAREHAQRMAGTGGIFHNDAYLGMISSLGATMLAENVGKGCSGPILHEAFMASPTHRSNILTGPLTHVGIGAATDTEGTLYVVEAFAAFPAPAPMQAQTVAPPPVAEVQPEPAGVSAPQPTAEVRSVAADAEPDPQQATREVVTPMDDTALVAARAAPPPPAEAFVQVAVRLSTDETDPWRVSALAVLVLAALLAVITFRRVTQRPVLRHARA